MNNQKDKSKGRVSIIRTVQTTLGFFVLGVLISEVILGALALRATGGDFTLLVIGMLFILFSLIVAVVIIDRRPGPILDPPRTAQNITGRYQADGNPNYTVIITRLAGDYYRISNPAWEGVGLFDGQFYYGVYKVNDKA